MTETNGHLDLGGYVLGLLPADDRARFEAHLSSCDACRAEIPTLEYAAWLRGAALPSLDPPPELRGRVLTIAHDGQGAFEAAPMASRRPHRRPRRAFGFALGIGTLATATAILILVLGQGRPQGELELQTVLRSPAGAQATVEVRKTGIGRVTRLRTGELPILASGEYYELWFVGPGDRPGAPNRISAGTFHPDENGRSDVTFAAAVDPAHFPVLSVTAEPADGDPRATGSEVLRST